MGQGFAHERLPEKGTVLLLDTYDLTEILKECQSYASVGYKIASSQHENLKTTLSNAASRINETLIDFNSSPCYVSSATDLLSQQLIDIESAFNNLSFAFKEDLENLRENLSKFSVTLLQEKGIQDNCQTLLTELEETCNDKIYLKQKKMLEDFLEHGAISQAQFDKSFGDLTEKMGMQEYENHID